MNQHDLEDMGGNLVCTICKWIWRHSPTDECPGVPRYAYGEVPDGFVSLTELGRRGLKAVEPPVACYKRARKPYTFLFFYDPEKAVPKKKATPAQLAALEKAKKALIAKHTCQKCGYYDKSHGKGYGGGIVTLEIRGEEKRYCSDCVDFYWWIIGRHDIEREMAAWLSGSRVEVVDPPPLDDELNHPRVDLFLLQKVFVGGVSTVFSRPFLILSTETTGLPSSRHFQLVEIVLLDKHGEVFFHTYVRPDVPMPAETSQYNGITDEMLRDAPTFPEIWPELLEIFQNYEIWCWGKDFRMQSITFTAYRSKLEYKRIINRDHWHCLLEIYAQYYGLWSDYHENYCWQSRYNACSVLGIDHDSSDRKDTVAKARSILSIMHALAKRGGCSPTPESQPSYHDSYGGW